MSPPGSLWRAWIELRRLVADDSGQDLIEYGLLTGIVGVSAILTYSAVTPAMADYYSGMLEDYETHWETPAPGGP